MNSGGWSGLGVSVGKVVGVVEVVSVVGFGCSCCSMECDDGHCAIKLRWRIYEAGAAMISANGISNTDRSSAAGHTTGHGDLKSSRHMN